MQYCSLQQWTLLPSPVTSTTGCCFCFGCISSFFLEKEMATHSSVLAWRIPWTEKLGRLQSMGLHRVGHDWSDLAASFFLELFFPCSPVAYWAPTDLRSSSFSVLSFCLFIWFMGFLKARILEKWFAIPFSSGPRFVITLHYDPSVLGVPTWHGSWFHWPRQDCGSMWSVWLVFSYCGFHSVGSLMDKHKKLMETSWWERLTERETGSPSDG